MKALVRALFVLSSFNLFVIAAHPQDVCSGAQAINVHCTGSNDCSQNIAVLQPIFSSAPTCLEQTYIWCCDTQENDYNNTGESCSFSCDDALKGLLKDPNASEFSLTHTLWAKDCSGHYRPFARSWDAPSKPLDLAPKLALSGIGG